MNRYFLFCCLFIAAVTLQAQDSLSLSFYYSSDQFQLPPTELLDISKTHQKPTQVPIRIVVSSFCDDVGSQEYNLKLSDRRARAMASYFHQIPGFEKVPIETKALGEIQIQEGGDTLAERSRNRRTDIILYYPPIQIPSNERITELEDLEVGEKMVLDNILFEGGTRRFLPESYPALDDLVNKLKASPTVKVRIIGHVCCTPGPDGQDLESGEWNLSVIRARTVYEYLIDKGIAASRLSFIGKGGSEPLGGDYKYDRRVELEIVEK